MAQFQNNAIGPVLALGERKKGAGSSPPQVGKLTHLNPNRKKMELPSKKMELPSFSWIW